MSLIARNPGRLAAAACRVEAAGAAVRTAAIDVADQAMVTDAADPCDVLVTEAGQAGRATVLTVRPGSRYAG